MRRPTARRTFHTGEARAHRGLAGQLSAAVVAVLLLCLAVVGAPITATAIPPASQATPGNTAADPAADTAADPAADPGTLHARRAPVRGTLVSLPAVVQPGTAPAAPSRDTSVVATFESRDPGQEVELQRRTSGGWRVVDTSQQDAWGSAAFDVRPGTYRARTSDGRHAWVTGTVKALRWEPAFEDTFSGAALDTSVWSDMDRPHAPHAGRSCALVDPRARRVAGGVLHLGVALDPARAGQACTYATPQGSDSSPYLLTSQVATEHTRHFRHGIIAARIKPQQAKGMHSGFWLLPQGNSFTYGDPTAGTEIDVMEFWGANGRGTETIGSHVHYYEPGYVKASHGDLFPAARRVLSPKRDWWEEFHVFSVEWTPSEYVFRVDGREYYRETRSISADDEFLILSMLASDYELDELTADELDDTAQVDWVQVFDAESTAAARVTRGRVVAGR